MRLIVVRHAKSDWSNPVAGDHDRALARRGIKASALIGAWLAERGYCPREVLCSSARRTRETWALLQEHLPETDSVEYERALYGASHDTILNLVRLSANSPVLVLGHNPGIAMFSAVMLRRAPEHARFYRFPTCATMVCEFPSPNWQSIRLGSGTCLDFVVPRDLG